MLSRLGYTVTMDQEPTILHTNQYRDTTIRSFQSGEEWHWSFRLMKDQETRRGIAPSFIMSIRLAREAINDEYVEFYRKNTS